MQELPKCSNPTCDNIVHPISSICWYHTWPKHYSEENVKKMLDLGPVQIKES